MLPAHEEPLVARVRDAFELTMILSVVSDAASRVKEGSRTRADLEKTEKSLWEMYCQLIRHRDVAKLEPELCGAADEALRKARLVYTAELERLMTVVHAREKSINGVATP